MDYLQIIINGITIENNRKYLKKYFYREFKKAEKEECYDFVTFFDGCLSVLEQWEKGFEKRLNDRKEELGMMRITATRDNDTEAINYVKTELKNITKQGFPIMLQGFTNNRLFGQFYYENWLDVMTGVVDARGLVMEELGMLNQETTEKEKQNPTVNPNETQTKPLGLATSREIVKPQINPDAIDDFYDALKPFFNKEVHNDLKTLLGTLETTDNKLLFRSNGNKLSDAFRQLHKANLITGWHQSDLINWVCECFTFLHKQNETEFKYSTVEKNISGKNYICKDPIIEILNGEVKKSTKK